MKHTIVTSKEIAADKTHRMDARYWINKKAMENKDKMVRVEMTLPESAVADLEAIAKEKRRSRKNFCETVMLELIKEYKNKKDENTDTDFELPAPIPRQ